MSNTIEATSHTPAEAAGTATQDASSVTGRSVFLVETVAAGVAVRTVFLTQEQKLLEMPAVFPDLGYALGQIDELRNAVMQHFSRAAQIGAQVIAAQQAAAPAAAEGAAPATQESAA